jgi:hypothetical protein
LKNYQHSKDLTNRRIQEFSGTSQPIKKEKFDGGEDHTFMKGKEKKKGEKGKTNLPPF